MQQILRLQSTGYISNIHHMCRCFRHSQVHGFRTSVVVNGKKSTNNDIHGDDVEWIEEISGEDELQGDFERVVLENQDWGSQAFDAAASILKDRPELEIYSFRAFNTKKVDIRLDKLTDTYGSPTLVEIGEFSREFYEELERLLGEEAAGEIEVEISSPGAERSIRVPEELERFEGLPMKVTTLDDDAQPRILDIIKVLQDEGLTQWRYSDVRANRSLGKGRGLSKKQKAEIIDIPFSNIKSVNLHVDI